MPPIPLGYWKMALISMQDIALNLRGHLQAGTLNMDQINSQLHPHAQMHLHMQISYREMDDQEAERISRLPVSVPKSTPPTKKTTSKGKQRAKRSSTPKLKPIVNKVYSTPMRQSSRLKVRHDNSEEPEFLFDLDSAKNIIVTPPSPKPGRDSHEEVEDQKRPIEELDNPLDEMNVDEGSFVQVTDSQPNSKDDDKLNFSRNIQDPVSDETAVGDENARTQSVVGVVAADPKDLTASHTDTPPDDDVDAMPLDRICNEAKETSNTTVSATIAAKQTFTTSSPHPVTDVPNFPDAETPQPSEETELSTPTPTTISQLNDASSSPPSPISSQESTDLAKPPANSTRSRARRSTGSTAELRKYAILNDVKKQVRIKQEHSDEISSTIPPVIERKKRKSVPREPKGRLMKKDESPVGQADKGNRASKSSHSPSTVIFPNLAPVLGSQAGTENHSGGNKSIARTGPADGTQKGGKRGGVDSDAEKEMPKPAKRPKLRLFLKGETAG